MSKWYTVRVNSWESSTSIYKVQNELLFKYNGRVKIKERVVYNWIDPLTQVEDTIYYLKFKDEADAVAFKLEYL